MIRTLNAFIQLTKPTIMLLVVLTGAAGLTFEGSLVDQPLRYFLVLFFLGMAGGAANAFNQYFERDVDAAMTRTRERRPLPRGDISPGLALAWALLLTFISTAAFVLLYNPLSALLSLGTILFYALFYTLYLKPNTPQNIVIGGLAGSMGPVIGWAAGAGTLGWEPVLMAAVIFFWTPPHFWALAIYLKQDYEQVGYPMLPNVIGEAATWRRILLYTGVTVAISLLLLLFGAGWIYGGAAVLLAVLFARHVLKAKRLATPAAARGAFGISILYLLLLFTALIVDRTILA